MGSYILRRLALIIPTLLGIMLLNFVIVQAAPGGPVEQLIAETEGHGGGALARASGGGSGGEVTSSSGDSRGSRGLPDELLREIEVMYGFDKPPHERFLKMLGDYATFDFGDSFFRDRSVIELILDKMPVSISLGLWSTLIIYLISIPLGIRKAVTDGSRFDVWSSSAIVVGYAIPGFLFAILLIVLFAGGSYLDWFPLRGLTSSNFDELNWYQKIGDYFWHLALPVTANVIGGFATLTLLTKNSFLDELSKQYVVTARAKGLEEKQVLYGHVFRNAMLIVIASLPGVLVSLFFTGSLLIEVIFSLDGLGLLGFEAALNRDYPVIFGTLFIFTLMGLVLKLISDITYVLVDPRIDFESREGVMSLVKLTPIQQRRLANFRKNRRGFWSLWIFLALFGLSLIAEVIANDVPLVAYYKGDLYFPVIENVPEETFGGFLPTEADYRDSFIADEIEANGWMIWPPIRFSYNTTNYNLEVPSPAPPSAENWIGTDDQGRDVAARVIYGFRISVLFGLILTILSCIVGVIVGAIQGFYGGKIDLLGQRFIEIWSGLPVLYLLIILSSIVQPNFWWLLGIMLLFSWMGLVDVVRAEFLRARNFEYVKAARALGLGNRKIMFRHILPNAMVATLTFLPFILTGAITGLTSLDFLGFGLPSGSPSLGELIAQGKSNLHAPWLGISAFVSLSIMLTLLVFVGEAVRDAFDPRKN